MGNSKKQIKSIAPIEVHNKCISLIQDELPGKLLDVPCGEGYASQKLSKLGFNVYAADIVEPKIMPEDVTFTIVDLNFSLPYEKIFFDYIYCIEGIEHIENPYHLIRQFHNVLKSGGKLIVSTPNLLNLYARLRFFLLGYADWFHERLNLLKLDELRPDMTLHINPICLPELYFILKATGFTVEKIVSSGNVFCFSAKNIFKKIVFTVGLSVSWLCIKFFNLFFRRDYPLRKELISNTLLCSENIIIKARKI